MGFLENDGDIILDAVITDTGRQRLARADGSFKIVKFALADDEIDYTLYNRNDSRGSAYYDVDILQTPILEAFTDNGASMKSKLISIPRSNLLFLPVLKLNEVFAGTATARRTSGGSEGTFVVPVNKDTEDEFEPGNGIILGENPGDSETHIRVDQGLDTTQISPNRAIDDDLLETRYFVEIDNRFGGIVSKSGQTRAQPIAIDDDDKATYVFSLGNDIEFVSENSVRETSNGQVIAGPRGTILEFGILASLELNSSTYLFTERGTTGTITGENGSVSIYYIDSIVKVTGATTGNSVDIPVRFIRKQ